MAEPGLAMQLRRIGQKYRHAFARHTDLASSIGPSALSRIGVTLVSCAHLAEIGCEGHVVSRLR